MRKKQLPWNLHYPAHSPMPLILQSPYSFAQRVSPCVKLSSHPILEYSPSKITSTSFRLPSSSNGSLAILPFRVVISPAKQPKKPPPLLQTQFFLFLYLVLFKSLTRWFVMPHQYMNRLLLYTNIKRFLEMQNRSNNRKDDVLIARLRSGNIFTDLIFHKIPPVRLLPRTRSPSLALRVPGFDNHETKSVWVPSRVLRVTSHLTWGCCGIHKDDLVNLDT